MEGPVTGCQPGSESWELDLNNNPATGRLQIPERPVGPSARDVHCPLAGSRGRVVVKDRAGASGAPAHIVGMIQHSQSAAPCSGERESTPVGAGTP